MCLHNAGLMFDSPVGLVFRNLQKACEWSVEDFKIVLPNERGESHVVVYSHRCWGPAPVFWAEGSHSQGCSAHRSHRQPEGWMRSAAAGCLPISRKKHHFMEFHGTSWSAIAGATAWINGCLESNEMAIQHLWVSPGKMTKVEVNEDRLLNVKFVPHLENLLIQQTGSEHRDAVSVNLCAVATWKGSGHFLLAVQQQCHSLLWDRESNAVPPTKEMKKCAMRCHTSTLVLFPTTLTHKTQYIT